MERWVEYFKDTLNGEYNEAQTGRKTNESNEGSKEEEAEEQPTRAELAEILKNTKNNKSPGENGIPSEFYKECNENLFEEIYDIILNTWTNKKMPRHWSEAIICPIYKKGETTNCSNYRGIALLDTLYKIFATIVGKRVKLRAEKILGEYQCGFRPNRSVTDQIFTLKQIITNSYEQNLPLHMLFIDFKQAYDTIDRLSMYQILQDLKIPKKLINLIKMTLSDTTCKIQENGKISKAFSVNKDVRQGDPVSSLLFNLVLEAIVRRSMLYTRGTIYDHKHQILAFADDITLITRSPKELKRIFKELEKHAAEVGLMINENKTKYMEVNKKESTRIKKLEIITTRRAYNFQSVENFEYLGVTISNNNEEETEVRKRLARGSRALGGLNNYLRSKVIGRKTKIRIYKTIVQPAVMYGSELWVMNECTRKQLDIWERKVLRRIYGGRKTEDGWTRRTNEDVMTTYGQASITRMVKARRLRWLGHVERMLNGRTSKTVLDRERVGKRSRGRPKKRWFQSVKKDLEEMNVIDWKEEAKNKTKWRHIVQAMGQEGL